MWREYAKTKSAHPSCVCTCNWILSLVLGARGSTLGLLRFAAQGNSEWGKDGRRVSPGTGSTEAVRHLRPYGTLGTLLYPRNAGASCSVGASGYSRGSFRGEVWGD